MHKVKVSVIVPVYKVEQYIERCARSLFSQTLADMEFIFVDDNSPDKSIDILKEVLEDYPQRLSQTVIIRNPTNLGPLQTRSKGQLAAIGEYLGAVDSDDWVEPDTYEKLYFQAISDNADAVIFGYHRDFINRSEKCIRIFPYQKGKDLVANVYRFPFEFFTWGALIRNDDRLQEVIKQYYNHEEWASLTMWEDVAVMFPFYYGANRISYSMECFYHYNKANENSAVNTQNLKKIEDAYKVMDYLAALYDNDPSLRMTINCLKFGAKGALMDIIGLDAWRNEHREANRNIFSYSSIPLKLRIYYYLLLKGFSFPYKLLKLMKEIGPKGF